MNALLQLGKHDSLEDQNAITAHLLLALGQTINVGIVNQ
jgi:hypothetical protein